ncbi:hypothetical protein [Streptomyces lavendulocolor]|uniref:hypothetical protein n=1 Tax=Streptomyces lavendulocolor TaxID=67316 RepID=UPI003C2E2084
MIVLAAVSGCNTTEQEREFEIPKALCGMAIDPGHLEVVLPSDGKTLSTRSSDLVGYDRCVVTVDGVAVLSATREWLRANTTVTSVASSVRGVKIDHVSEDRRYAWGAQGAVSQVSCPKPKEKHQDMQLWVKIFTANGGRPDEDRMRALVLDYTRAVSESDECTTG